MFNIARASSDVGARYWWRGLPLDRLAATAWYAEASVEGGLPHPIVTTGILIHENAFRVLTHWAFERAAVLAGPVGFNASEHHLSAALWALRTYDGSG
jgi:hypothetical protein